MIPNFRTYIKESIWRNISQRSEGIMTRKEDNIDLLDFDDFYKYVKDNYKDRVFDISKSIMPRQKYRSCDVDIIDNVFLVLFVHDDVQKNSISFFWDKVQINTDFFKEISKKFDVDYRLSVKCMDIHPKKGQSCNRLYIQFLDFVLDNIDNMFNTSGMTESIWRNISQRSEGIKKRKEDDINLLDGEDFTKYLKKLYQNVDTPYYIFIDVENVITVPIIKYKGQTICIYYDCTNNIVYGRFDFLYYHDPDLFEKLRKEYKTFMLRKSYSTYVKIEPRVGEFSNKFFIEIIDFYLENCNTDLNAKKILVKNVNESIWRNISQRSEGIKKRKEDTVRTNIKEIKPIDLGNHCLVYFADQDLIFNGNRTFSADEKNSLQLPDGWRIPNEEELTNAIYKAIWFGNQPNRNVIIETNFPESVTIKGKKTGEELTFDLMGNNRADYWCADRENSGVEIGYVPLSDGDYVIYGKCMKTPARIRLVKDK